MKKTQKKIIGLTGLALVIAVTIFAAFLPNPGASAVSSVTDTIIVRVVGSTPSAEILNPASGSTFVSSAQTININYEHVQSLDILVRFKDRNGVEHTKLLHTGDVTDVTGSLSYDFNELADEFGFGEYTVLVSGTGVDGTPLPGDSVNFLFVPVLANVEKDPESEKTYLDLDYDPYTEDGAGKVSSLEINIYDENGNLVESLSPITVNAPDTRVEIPFSEYDLKSGKYSIEITAFGKSGDDLYKPYVTSTDYEAKEWSGEEVVPDANVPNTGSLFESLNISKADYLITGAIIFFIAGISAFAFIIKRSHSSNKK